MKPFNADSVWLISSIVALIVMLPVPLPVISPEVSPLATLVESVSTPCPTPSVTDTLPSAGLASGSVMLKPVSAKVVSSLPDPACTVLTGASLIASIETVVVPLFCWPPGIPSAPSLTVQVTVRVGCRP